MEPVAHLLFHQISRVSTLHSKNSFAIMTIFMLIEMQNTFVPCLPIFASEITCMKFVDMKKSFFLR